MLPAVCQAVIMRRWSPMSIGAGGALLGYWDAERIETLTLAGSAVTTWADLVGGYAPTQSTAGSKPVYSATSFNGRPGITFDGTDDFLSLGTTPFPLGAARCEMWALVDQTMAAAMTGGRRIFAYGDSDGFAARAIARGIVSATNTARGIIGNGAGSSFLASSEPADFSGRHLVRLEVGAASSIIWVDGIAGAPGAGAGVPGTATGKTVIGADSGATAAFFFGGVISALVVIDPTHANWTASVEARLTAWGKARGSIA